jgi:hypothetical protein
MFLRRTESHDLLDAGPVVPGPVEQHDLALRGEVRDVALVVPLAALPVSGCGQGGDAGHAGAEILRDPLDGATLACGVATFEDDGDARTGMPRPLLQLDEFRLETE